MNNLSKFQTFCFLIIIFICGCGSEYVIRYGLDKENIKSVPQSYPIKVIVLPFKDACTGINNPQGDLEDYTHNIEFRGNVSEEITKMVTEHLCYSNIFSKIEYRPYLLKGNEDLSKTRYKLDFFPEIDIEYLDNLFSSHIDAVLVGEIRQFYGYYQTSALGDILPATLGFGFGLPMLLYYKDKKEEEQKEEQKKALDSGQPYNPFPKGKYFDVDLWISAGAFPFGYYLGSIIESSIKREIECNTELSVKLVSTKSYKIIWEDNIAYKSKEYKALPGFNTENRKFELALESLRKAVNLMVERLSKNKIVENLNDSIDRAVFDKQIGTIVSDDTTQTTVLKESQEEIPPSFSIELKTEDINLVLGDKFTITYTNRAFSRSILSFRGIMGVGKNQIGPFNTVDLEISKGDVFYIQVSSNILYRIKVEQEVHKTITLSFTKM